MSQKAATPQQSNYGGDSQSGYTSNIDGGTQVSAALAWQFAPHSVPPAVPTASLSQTPGGSIGATTYYARITYQTAGGFEVAPSAEQSLAVSANNLLVVASPNLSGSVAGVVGYNVYVSTSPGTETKQNVSGPVALGTNWTEPTSGLIAGTALPAGVSTMSVLVEAGQFVVNGVMVSQPQQNSATITAPSVNPRIDRVVIDSALGTISIITGVENASPVAPALTPGKLACAQIALVVAQTIIGNSNITDERPQIQPGGGASLGIILAVVNNQFTY